MRPLAFAQLTFSLSVLVQTLQTTGTTPTTGTAASPGLTFITNKAGDLAYQVADQADKAGGSGSPKTSGTPPDFLVDVQLGLAVAGGGLEGLPEDSCLAADFDELKDAVEVRLVLGGYQILSSPSNNSLIFSSI